MNSGFGIEDPSAWRAAFAPWHVLREHQMKAMETYWQYFVTNAVRRNHANFKALSGIGGQRTKWCSESHASSVLMFSAQELPVNLRAFACRLLFGSSHQLHVTDATR